MSILVVLVAGVGLMAAAVLLAFALVGVRMVEAWEAWHGHE